MDENTRVSNQVIAHGVLEALKDAGYDHFTTRPWNFFEPDARLWWIVPSTKWPAYQYGKLFLSRTQSGYRIGFNIEKGIIKDAGLGTPSKNAQKLFMKPDWVWNRFLLDLSSGAFAKHLNEIADTVDQTIRITVQVADITLKSDPSSKPPEGCETDHVVAWSYQDGKLTCQQDELKGAMWKYGAIDNLADMQFIFAEEDMDWLWVDLRVFFEIRDEQLGQINEYALNLVRNYEALFGSN